MQLKSDFLLYSCFIMVLLQILSSYGQETDGAEKHLCTQGGDGLVHACDCSSVGRTLSAIVSSP